MEDKSDAARAAEQFLLSPCSRARPNCKLCKHAKRADIEAAVVRFEQLKKEGKTSVPWFRFVLDYLVPTYGQMDRRSAKDHMEKCHGTKIT